MVVYEAALWVLRGTSTTTITYGSEFVEPRPAVWLFVRSTRAGDPSARGRLLVQRAIARLF